MLQVGLCVGIEQVALATGSSNRYSHHSQSAPSILPDVTSSSLSFRCLEPRGGNAFLRVQKTGRSFFGGYCIRDQQLKVFLGPSHCSKPQTLNPLSTESSQVSSLKETGRLDSAPELTEPELLGCSRVEILGGCCFLVLGFNPKAQNGPKALYNMVL